MKINGEVLPTLSVFPNMMTVPDCVVARSNKLGRGNGEAKFYIASKDDMYDFYGGQKFTARCFMLKADLIAYMTAIKNEYQEPSQEYARKEDLPKLWAERMLMIEGLDDVIFFNIYDQHQITGPRGYINSPDKGYQLIRQLALPLVSYIYVEKVGLEAGDSKNQVLRYIRLTNLIPGILDMVDEGKIALTPAVELSYLGEWEQRDLLETMESEDCTPSLSQAMMLKATSQAGQLTMDKIFTIMTQPKPNQQEKISFKVSEIRDYFPRGYTASQMTRDILKGLELLKQQRQRNRDAR